MIFNSSSNSSANIPIKYSNLKSCKFKIPSISDFATVSVIIASIISRPAGKQEGKLTEQPAPTKKVNFLSFIRFLKVKPVAPLFFLRIRAPQFLQIVAFRDISLPQ